VSETARRRGSRWPLILLVLAILAFAAAYFGSPYYALYQLKTAAQTGDRDRLEQYVDFPSVRDGLKSQLGALLMRQMHDDPDLRDNPFAGLAAAIAPAIIDKGIDAYVTPDALSSMIARGEGPRVEATARADPPPGPASPERRTSGSNVKTDFEYVGLDRFRANLRPADEPAATPVRLVLERRGVFGWKLVRVDLPSPNGR
jgi:hypothetical protein